MPRNRGNQENVPQSKTNSVIYFLVYAMACAMISIIFYKFSDAIIRNDSTTVPIKCEPQIQNTTTIVIDNSKRLKYWKVCIEQWNKNGNLRSMDRVFEKLGYEFVNATAGDDFDIMWSKEHPYYVDDMKPLYPLNETLKPHQKVNHFFGNNDLVDKSRMTTLNKGSPYIMPAFRKTHINELKEYIKENPHKLFVKKHYYNRGVEIVEADKITDDVFETFYQEFLANPFLVDGHAMDMGVFVLITSINPLRVYRFKEEVLLRFCPEKYYPFDKTNRRKYVVNDSHLPTYQMKIFNETYKNYKFTFKSLLEDYIADKGFNVEKMWKKVDDAIAKIVLSSRPYIKYKFQTMDLSSRNFFELVRFDFVIDENLHPFVMEVNMSPNMTPAESKFAENYLIYEQIINNVVNIIGGGSYQEFMSRFNSDTTIVHHKNIAVGARSCVKFDCVNNCDRSECKLCLPCLDDDILYEFREAYRENLHTANFKRVFPTELHFYDEELKSKLSYKDNMMIDWYTKKCFKDENWC